MSSGGFQKREVPRFKRKFVDSPESVTRIGDGEIGGKAGGLVFIRDLIEKEPETQRLPGIEVFVPTLTVLATDVFDAFMQRNGLDEIAHSEAPDERIAHAFQKASFPVEHLGDLRALVEQVHAPLAVRSSSLLEDALFQPFAGVYETKMIPNNQPDADTRFRRLVEAVKFVYASTFFRAAKSYIRATDKEVSDEKMAVVIQEVVGRRFGDRFYPHVSGVGRSYNFFPSGRAEREDGVVNLALGLGKTIVDGGASWIYSPAHPKAPPPFGSPRELLKNTQLKFWAVNMGKPPAYDPTAETEYLVEADLAAAEYDGTLPPVASTCDTRSGRLVPGTGPDGARVLNFAPLLAYPELPFNDLVKRLLAMGREALGRAVEMEFAVTFPPKWADWGRFGFLQLRPMLVSDERVEIEEEEMRGHGLLLASERVMGNGVLETIRDVVYVKPEAFEARLTARIAAELEDLNGPLLRDRRPYLLIGFGRWGSSDPWLGIPVKWGQIAGARVIVEATLPNMNPDPSQGAHFFHNIVSFQVSYFTVRHAEGGKASQAIDWEWLGGREVAAETDHVRHVRLARPLLVKVDGRTGRGAVWHHYQ